jgi:hypothetical protein
MSDVWKPPVISLTAEEIDEMRQQAKEGSLPPDAVEQYFTAMAKNVFGAAATKDKQGNYREMGIGSKGHETANHFTAIRSNEMRGMEPAGAYDAAVAEIWGRDPKRAAALRLPKPQRAAS